MSTLRQEILKGEWIFREDRPITDTFCSICKTTVQLDEVCYFGHRPDTPLSGCLLCKSCMDYFMLSNRLEIIDADKFIDQATRDFKRSLQDFKRRINASNETNNR